MLAASSVNSSFHVWEVLWDSCQLRVAIQAQIPSNTYLRETFRERLELIVTQVQIPTNTYLREAFGERLELIATQAQIHTADQCPERRRQLADLAVVQKLDPQFAPFRPLIAAEDAVLEHLLPMCTRADEHVVSHQDLGCLAVLASVEQLPYPLLQQFSHPRASAEAWQHTCRMQAYISSLLCRAISVVVVLHASIIKILWDWCSPVEVAMSRIMVRRLASCSTRLHGAAALAAAASFSAALAAATSLGSDGRPAAGTDGCTSVWLKGSS